MYIYIYTCPDPAVHNIRRTHKKHLPTRREQSKHTCQVLRHGMLSTCIWVAFGMDVDQNSKIKLDDKNMIVNEDGLYQWLFLVPLLGGR